jgi:hypothetical protein
MVNRCCLCKLNRESVDRLLLHCEVISALWNAIFSCFGLSWVMPNNVVDLFVYWWLRDNSRSAAVWKMVPLCLMCGACEVKEMIGTSITENYKGAQVLFPFFSSLLE